MRESPQAIQFKKLLPEELQEIMDVTFSYQHQWKITSDHLQTLYGIYASPEYCLSAYYDSDEYRKNCHIARRCPDLTLIDMDDILNMLDEEAQYRNTVQELLTMYHQNNDNNIDKMASLLGILPDDNPKALYRHLIAKSHISEQELSDIKRRVAENKNLIYVITNILAKTFIPGYLLEYPAVGSVMTQQRGRYYYRGENAYYRASKASCFRFTDITKPASIQAFIDRLRLYQCCETLDQFDAVHHWSFCEVNYLALAQHYGFRTQKLDITSDLKTALFFACCKYGNDNKWHPLTKDDFAHRNSRCKISKNGGDSRYGVLYRSPSEITDIRWCLEPMNTAQEIIIPVGYQPFMRCSHQHAYMQLTQSDYDLFKDKRFDKFKFRLTEDICNWIYEEMEQGNSVYPNDDAGADISDEIGNLNDQMVFSINVFEAAAKDFKLNDEDIINARKVLEQYGFTIDEKVSVVVLEKLSKINSDYSAKIAMRKIGITPQMSPVLRISSNIPVNENGELVMNS